MAKLVLDVRESVEGNAAVYFERAKKSRKKLEGAKAALERSQQKLQQLILEKQAAGKRIAAAAEDKEKIAARALQKAWYEKFRWFISSEGFLCIGGRDATTNEIIIKKHTDSNDLVFHTELAGSPFFVVKSQSSSGGSSSSNNSSGEKEGNAAKAVGESTIGEAAAATASYSRAWKAGLHSVDVYYVRPEQVSKEAKAGEYLVKGAFMIYGKKSYVPATIGLAIGVTDKGKIMGGPLAAAAKNCVKSVKLLQGDNKPSDAAKKIAKLLGLNNSGSYLDEIIRAMPAGECKVIA
ncbi:MAG: NFACT RNA binding domain-containing protein [Nanoarchaeota archaeon]